MRIWAGDGSLGGERRRFLLGQLGRSSHSRENLKEKGWWGGALGPRSLIGSLLVVVVVVVVAVSVVALLRMEMPSDALAMSLPVAVVAEESPALPGGVTSPGRVLTGALNGIMFFMKLHRFLGGDRIESLEVAFGIDVLGVVDCVEDIWEMTLSKEVNMLMGRA